MAAIPQHPAPAAGPSPAPAQGANLRTLLEEMIERGASDLHITAGQRAKLRVDGDIINSKNEYVMSAKDIGALAMMPSREELLAKLLGTMQAPIAKFVQTLNEVPGKFVRTLAALRDQKEKAAA